MVNTSLVFLDVETTGLKPREHGIHQFSGIFEVDGEVVDEFDYHLRVPAYKEFSPEALDMAQYTKEMLISPDRMEIKDAYLDLKPKLEKYGGKYVYGGPDEDKRLVVVGYNAQFDIDFLKGFWTDLKRVGVVRGNEHFHSWFNYYYVDMYREAAFLRAKGFLKTDRLKLEVVAEALGIKFKAHDSLEDSKATREFFHMVGKSFQGDVFNRLIKEAQDGERT